jgi:hypothetical protein
LGGEDLKHVILAQRHEGAPLTPVRSWPTAVFVCALRIPIRDALATGVTTDALKMLGWAEIYDCRSEADKAIGLSSD